MSSRRFAVCPAVLFFIACFTLPVQAVPPVDTISFSDTLSGVDPNTSGWSGDSTTVGLGTSSWSLLGGQATVSSIGGLLSHRLTRGIGILGGSEADEIDTVQRLAVVFVNPFILSSIEVRSLFTGELGGTERGKVTIYSNGEKVAMQQFWANEPDGNGVKTIAFNLDTPIDKMVFSVPLSARGYSEYALSKVTGTIVPEPVSAALFLIGGVVLIGRARRKRL